jgi:hypothetical protein
MENVCENIGKIVIFRYRSRHNCYLSKSRWLITISIPKNYPQQLNVICGAALKLKSKLLYGANSSIYIYIYIFIDITSVMYMN